MFLMLSGIYAQNIPDSFFTQQNPLKIALNISLKEVEKSRKDSLFLKQQLYFLNSSNIMDSLKVGIKERGNFRSRECYFPPLWIKIKPKVAKGTPFEGNKKLKLVLPCYNKEGKNALILKEFLCYKLMEEVSIYSFQTRLVDVDLTVVRGKKKTNTQLKGIFIEDLEKVATRLHAKPLKNIRIHPNALHDTSAVRFEMFQYMISNTDWSTVYQHNTKLIVKGTNHYISVMYDFDMSGLVDAPYSVVSVVNGEQLPVNHVTERIYRGVCRDPGVMEYVRQEFLSKQEKYLSIPDDLNGELPADEIEHIKKYLGEFFETLKSDKYFNADILNRCIVK
jgi:hypothetical protein